MLRIYSFTRRAMLVVTMSFTILAMAMITPSAHAQRSIMTIAEAETYLTTGREFYIDMGGFGAAEYTFRITSFNADHTFEGIYYQGGHSPALPNVRGSITTVDIFSRGRLSGIATRISFIEGAITGIVVVGGTQFEGAIRFGRPGSKDRSFMAGTFSINSRDGGSSTGPFPFTAMSN